MGKDQLDAYAAVDPGMGYPEIFAGLECQGAADAAYEKTISMELSRLRGEDCTPGAAAIVKCFDHIRRPLVYEIMDEAGMPSRIRKAYERFQEKLNVHNTIVGGMGMHMLDRPAYPKGTRYQ